MRQRYTDQDVQNALAAYELNGRNIKRTARELGVPEPTLRGWVLRAGLKPEQNTSDNGGHDYGGMWGQVQALAVDKAVQAIPDIPHTPDGLRALTVLAGVAADKYLDYRDGRKGAAATAAAPLVPVQIVINTPQGGGDGL